MKFVTTFLFLFLFTALVANAQFREDLSHQPEQYTTSVSTSPTSGAPGNWMNMLNMSMSHSYSMTFSNFGGQMQNINAYTNHMYFDLSDRWDAQVDVSVLHSPFGNSFMSNDNSLGAQIIVDQARLDYQISPNAKISFQFSQRPAYYGYGGYGGFGAYHSPFRRTSPWY